MVYHIIVNPAGASGRTGKIWTRIERVFRESGKEYEVHYSAPDHGIEAICRELGAAQPARNDSSGQEKLILITVGGDGSVNEAMNGIPDPSRVLYGHIPAGSGNDLVRDMDLPKEPEDVARRILDGRVRRCFDVGELEYADTGEKRRFAVSCGIGFDAGICEMAGRSRYKDMLNKIGLGQLIYIVSAFRIVSGQVSDAVEIVLDGEQTVHYDHLLLLACMNHRFEGGGFQFAPDAACDDGVLNLCVADPVHNSAFYKIFPFAPSGRHLRFKEVHMLSGRTIEVTTKVPLWVHTDGEVARKATHIRIRTLPQQLAVLE